MNCRLSRLAHEMLIEAAKRNHITYARAATDAICAAWRLAKEREDLPPRERKAQQGLHLTGGSASQSSKNWRGFGAHHYSVMFCSRFISQITRHKEILRIRITGLTDRSAKMGPIGGNSN
jgi:hypothetical protein